MLPIILEIVGTVLSILGAVFTCSCHRPKRWWGFLIWIVSNICWLTFAALTGLWWMFGMFVIYTITSLIGLWNNWCRHEGTLYKV